MFEHADYFYGRVNSLSRRGVEEMINTKGDLIHVAPNCVFGIKLTHDILEKSNLLKEVTRMTGHADIVSYSSHNLDDNRKFRLLLLKTSTEPIRWRNWLDIDSDNGYTNGEVNLDKDCQYVHELQQLYFTLFGTRLEINF